ncbi:hypothetical protein LNQ52_27755 [Klebsiella pneumoniae subsp. pneumoniae]|nr:hypothetical protein [Klebsiella pneumoniae subsp. pneumoniae]
MVILWFDAHFSSHSERSESLQRFGLPFIFGFGNGCEKYAGILEGVLQKYSVLREILYLDKTSLVIKISTFV